MSSASVAAADDTDSTIIISNEQQDQIVDDQLALGSCSNNQNNGDGGSSGNLDQMSAVMASSSEGEEDSSPPRPILKTSLSLDHSAGGSALGPSSSSSSSAAGLMFPVGDGAALLSVRDRDRLVARHLMSLESPSEKILLRKAPKKNLSALICESMMLDSPAGESQRAPLSRIIPRDNMECDSPMTPPAAGCSGSFSHQARLASTDWNKENRVPADAAMDCCDSQTTSATPKSLGALLKRPLTACDMNVVIGNDRLRRQSPFGICNTSGATKRSMSQDDEKTSPKLRKLSVAGLDLTPVTTSKSGGRFGLQQPSMLGVPKFTRSFSETHAAVIKRACNLAQRPNMTADMRHSLALPTLDTGKKHQDLNTISCHTLADLIRGEYSGQVESFRIIDARYVYEFQGGHIVGAENFGAWDERAFVEEFLPQRLGAKSLDGLTHLATVSEDMEQDADDEQEEVMANTGAAQQQAPPAHDHEKRTILIFHCEFSSQRGPGLMKELRKRDRMVNQNSYPALHYPEIYLLHNGYKEFYETYPELCEPRAYQTMKDSAFSAEEKMFRKKSKSWGAPGTTVARTGASASRLFKF